VTVTSLKISLFEVVRQDAGVRVSDTYKKNRQCVFYFGVRITLK